MDELLNLDVDCSSGRSGSGPATWGQQAIWDVVRNLGSDAARYNVSVGAPVPPGVPVSLVLDSLRQLVLLHESLRTRLVLSEDGRLEQVVDATGIVPVYTRQCPDEEAQREGEALLAEIVRQPFETGREWPIRVGLVESAGFVRHIAFAMSHTAADAWGLQCMVLNLTSIAMGEQVDQISARRFAPQPLEEAAFQSSARGLRQDLTARRYWSEKLQAGSHRLFPNRPGGMDGPLFPNAVLNSPALHHAVGQVAAQRQVSSSSVLLAAASTMICRLSGSPDAMLQIVVNNRFLPRLTHSVSTVAQEGLFHLPDVGVGGGSGAAGQEIYFPDVVRRTHAATLAVYRNAYYNKGLLNRDIEELEAMDGATADRSCFLNDVRGLMPPAQDESETPAATTAPVPLEKERNRTTLRWPIEFEPRQNTTFALDALDAPGSIELSMTADSAVISRAGMEQFLYGIEDLVVHDALELGRG